MTEVRADTTPVPAPISYDLRYVAFIDILGFREHVNALDGDEEKMRELGAALDHISNFSNTGNSSSLGTKGILSCTAFSDNIVISTEHSVGGLAVLALGCAALCMRLLELGMLVRGAISEGKIHHSPSMVFGKGLVTSYLLESQTAVYPRIVIEERVINAPLLKVLGQHFPVARDFDGIAYLDYLSYVDTRLAEDIPELQAKPHVERIRGRLVETLNSNGNMGIRAKHGWMARYLNGYAEKLGMVPIPLD